MKAQLRLRHSSGPPFTSMKVLYAYAASIALAYPEYSKPFSLISFRREG
jgi:hypothetical protein